MQGIAAPSATTDAFARLLLYTYYKLVNGRVSMFLWWWNPWLFWAAAVAPPAAPSRSEVDMIEELRRELEEQGIEGLTGDIR